MESLCLIIWLPFFWARHNKSNGWILLYSFCKHFPTFHWSCKCGFIITCGNKKKKIFLEDPEPKRFFSGNFSEFFLQSLCIKRGSNERSALTALRVFGSGIILHKERVPAAVGAELREICQHFHSARADVVEIVDMKQGHKVKCRFSISVFFKCLFWLRQGWYLAREFNTNLMKGIIGQETEAGVTYSSS